MGQDTKTGNGSRGVVLLVTTLASFMTPFMVSAVNIALPSIGTEFALDAVTLNWVATAYLLAAAMFLVPVGRLADIYGRKRVFNYGLITYTLTSLLAAMSPNAAMLIACRALQGTAAAMIFGTGVAILTSAFPANERGRVLGINIGTVYVGLSVGPLLGGLLTEQFGWRSIFFVTIVVGLVSVAAVLWRLKGEWAEAKGEKFDLAGSIIYCLGLVAIMFGLSLLPAVPGAVLIAAGLIGLLVFIRWEMRASSPVLSVNLFRNNIAFSLSNLAALINYSATYAVSFLMSLYLQYIKGFSPEDAGLVLIAMPAVQAILSPFTGRLSDRIEPGALASIGMGLTCAGLGMFIFLDRDTDLAFIVSGLVLLGLGFGFFSSPNTNAIMSAVDRKFYGVGSGILSTMRLVGQMFSMGIALLLFAIYIGRVQITPEYYPAFMSSVKTAFLVFSILCFAGIFASLARGKTR